jgi:hypothetical protein
MKKFKLGLFITTSKRNYNEVQASFWIRIFQMVEFYQELGIEVHVNNYFTRYDAAILFRKVKPKYYRILLYLKAISKKVYFDTCINIFDLHEEMDEKRLKYAFKITQKADGIICASKQLGRLAQPHSKRVFVMEDPVNLKHFKLTKKTINFDNPIFGWSGVGVKAVYLEKYAPYIDNKIVIISEEQIKRVPLSFIYEYHKWSYETFPDDILKCDIALLPRVLDDAYNNNHSSFKALVYAASGIPIIANKIPSYVNLSEYYNGIVFLEDNDDSIEKCIEILKNRPIDATKVREYYSCENQARLILNFLSNNSKP